jgi:hypothetical protein
MVNCCSHFIFRMWADNFKWAGIVQSVQRFSAGWTVRGSNPGVSEIFSTRLYRFRRPNQPPVRCVSGFVSGVKAAGAWRWLPHRYLAPKLKKSIAILLTLCAFMAFMGSILHLSDNFDDAFDLCSGTRWRSGWGTALQIGRSRVRFTMVPLDFFIDKIIPAALWPWGWLSLLKKWVPGIFPGG